MALVDSGSDFPTTSQVAARAGVSVRVLFHHFHGTRALMVAAVVLQSERHRDVLFTVPPRGSPDLRVRALCRQRRIYFEGLAPVVRMAGSRRDAARDLEALMAGDRAHLRRQLAATLAPEVAARGAEADSILDALQDTTGWEAWRALRDVRGLSAAGAERAMAYAARRMLG